MALAGVTACTVQPDELIVPYVRQPEEEIPGKPLFFATAMTLGGVATGLLVESHEGRPTKIEGNPDHPASKGATDLFAQGSILTLYDPDRSQTLTQLGDIRPWSSLIGAMRGGLSAQAASKGAGLRILTETVASPTLAAQIQQVLAQNPGAKWIQWEPVNRDNARAGARTAFGQYVEPMYDLTKADVILSLESDFLSSEGALNLYYMRQFASRRRVEENADNLNRLYVVEADHSVTGGRADNRLPLKSSQIEAFARAVAAASGRQRRQRHRTGGLARHLPRRSRRICRSTGAAPSSWPAIRSRPRCTRSRTRINAAIGAPVTSYLPTPEIVRQRTDRRARRAGVGHQRRSRADAGDHRRIESRVQRAGGLQVRGGDAQGQPGRALGPVLRRDRDAQSLARPGDALPRSLERRAHHRRHRVDRAAVDPAALRRQVGARSDCDDVGTAGTKRLRHRSGVLAEQMRRCRSAGAQVHRCTGCTQAHRRLRQQHRRTCCTRRTRCTSCTPHNRA